MSSTFVIVIIITILVLEQSFLGLSDTKTIYHNDVLKICNSIIQNIRNVNVKNKLTINRPSYIIGESILDYPVFEELFNRTTDDGRYFHDITAFAASEMLPGYISTDVFTKDDYYNEDVIAHEILHSINAALPPLLRKRLEYIFEKYLSMNDTYDITAYGFMNPDEMFAVFGTVFLGVNDRLDTTSNIILDSLHEHLPELYIFLQDIFNKNTDDIIHTSCIVYDYKKTYCEHLSINQTLPKML